MPPKSVLRAQFRGLFALGSLALVSAFANARTPQTEFAVIGPLEQIDCSRGTVQVLGLTIQVTAKESIAALCADRNGSATEIFASRGTLGESNRAKAQIAFSIAPDQYVPGATTVFLHGPVSAIKPDRGEFWVAGVRIQAMSGQVPAVGEVVEVVGTQPVPRGVVIAQDILKTKAILGYDATINGIIGSGASTKGIIGSGAATSGIIGSGAATNGIIGSGASTKGIIGSGASTKGIIGSGAVTSGIIGSGASTSGIIGSGASTKGIIGSGASTKGIIGSGAVTSGIIGSGAATNGIIGSGARTKGIIGSGKKAS